MIQIDPTFNTVEPADKGVYQDPPSGGYELVCIGVSEEPSKSSGNPMVTLFLDIAEGEFKGAFQKYPAKYYQIVAGEQTKYFKGMLTAFKNSNSPCPKMIENNQFNSNSLIGLKIAGALQEEEYINNSGELKSIMKIAYLRSIDKLNEIEPLPKKKIKNTPPLIPNNEVNPLHSDDDLPF